MTSVFRCEQVCIVYKTIYGENYAPIHEAISLIKMRQRAGRHFPNDYFYGTYKVRCCLFNTNQTILKNRCGNPDVGLGQADVRFPGKLVLRAGRQQDDLPDIALFG
jgi:hypothetical protein